MRKDKCADEEEYTYNIHRENHSSAVRWFGKVYVEGSFRAVCLKRYC